MITYFSYYELCQINILRLLGILLTRVEFAIQWTKLNYKQNSSFFFSLVWHCDRLGFIPFECVLVQMAW